MVCKFPPPCLPARPAPVAAFAVGVGNNEHTEPSVGRAGVGSANACPLRVIPEVGQVSEYSAECPQMRLSGVSHTPAAAFQIAMGVGTEQSYHVLRDHQGGSQLVDGVGHVRPQPGAGART